MYIRCVGREVTIFKINNRKMSRKFGAHFVAVKRMELIPRPRYCRTRLFRGTLYNADSNTPQASRSALTHAETRSYNRYIIFVAREEIRARSDSSMGIARAQRSVRISHSSLVPQGGLSRLPRDGNIALIREVQRWVGNCGAN